MPAKRAVVADASALAAIIFQEPEALELAKALHDADLFEPSLLPYEIASVARKKIIKSPSNRELILQAMRIGLNSDMHLVDVDEEAAVTIALEKKITLYDAAYLWTARFCQASLITLDQQLLAAWNSD